MRFWCLRLSTTGHVLKTSLRASGSQIWALQIGGRLNALTPNARQLSSQLELTLGLRRRLKDRCS